VSEEENLPSAEDMRARYADLMKEDETAAEATGQGPEATEGEATGHGPQATEPEPEAPAADEDALPSAEDMRARYAHLMDDASAETAEEAPVAAAAAPAPSAVEPLPPVEPEPVAEEVDDPSDDLAAHLLDVNVRLWAELGRAKLPLAQAVSLGEGAIVDLDKEPEEALDVLVNGLPFAKARLLLVDGEWAIRLDEIVATPGAVEQASSSGSGA
jgi:flagellar motor switch protein FliN/FliY